MTEIDNYAWQQMADWLSKSFSGIARESKHLEFREKLKAHKRQRFVIDLYFIDAWYQDGWCCPDPPALFWTS